VNLGLVALEKPEPDPLQAGIDAGMITDAAWYDARADTRRYSVIVSRDNLASPDVSLLATDEWRWHISVAGEDDVPRWRDLVAIAHELRPGVPFAVGVPPRSWWMSVHPHCLHLWQIEDAALVAQWRHERMGVAPS